jgi:hypothetical protein
MTSMHRGPRPPFPRAHICRPRMASLDAYPSEIYSAILSHIPGHELSATTYALIRALPRAPIPLSHLFEFVHIRRASQVFPLYRRLRKAPEAACVKEIYLQTWTVDADLVVGLLRLLKDLRVLHMWIGPNFAPEHMEVRFLYFKGTYLC